MESGADFVCDDVLSNMDNEVIELPRFDEEQDTTTTELQLTSLANHSLGPTPASCFNDTDCGLSEEGLSYLNVTLELPIR